MSSNGTLVAIDQVHISTSGRVVDVTTIFQLKFVAVCNTCTCTQTNQQKWSNKGIPVDRSSSSFYSFHCFQLHHHYCLPSTSPYYYYYYYYYSSSSPSAMKTQENGMPGSTILTNFCLDNGRNTVAPPSSTNTSKAFLWRGIVSSAVEGGGRRGGQ